MIIKKLSFFTCLVAVATSAIAAPQVDFNVEAVIPDNAFYVTPVSGWDAQVQKMSWNESSGSLSPVSQQLKMKNSSGGIKAYLSGEPVLTSSSSTDNIALQVNVAGKTLPYTAATAVTLYSDTEASSEKTATMTVSQKDTSTRPAAGTYLGAVTMIFDAVPPPAP